MAKLSCFPTLHVGRKKKSKDSPKSVDARKENTNIAPQVMLEDLNACTDRGGKDTSRDNSVSLGAQGTKSSHNEKVMLDENLVRAKMEAETAYEGGDEHDDILSMKRDYSDFDLQALGATKEVYSYDPMASKNELNNNRLEHMSEKGVEGITPELEAQNGHMSDPGMGQTTAFWGSPMLKRSCSNIENKRSTRLPLSPTKSHSYNDLQNLSGNDAGDLFKGFHGSPLSMVSKCSADKVMLKKRSSSQVLPSRSRKVWWKLFLWSHRNLHKPWAFRTERILSTNGATNQKGGYSSDTLEPKPRNKKVVEEPEIESRADLWTQNQWVAFSVGSSPLDRVNAWVNSLNDDSFCPIDDEDDEEAREITLMSTSEVGESSGKNHSHTSRRVPEEVVQANNIIQSMNSFSTVAHISGMGLKVIPSISAFSSLRAVNLSGNFIVHINPGSLPKSLHVLDLSRNKISTIEGLRELTRLRVLNLSYNRISRISHGLSNCTLIKELYLAGNKISDVEGLHRLLKLTVLDLSFNKITTTKALGQLVANYHSLQALNLLGNPIQSNIGDDQLRKAVCSLLPFLAYLNKQPVKPQRAREVATDSVAKAALGNSAWSSRRRLTRRLSQGSSSPSVHRGASSSVSGHKSSRHRSKSKHRHSSSTRK